MELRRLLYNPDGRKDKIHLDKQELVSVLNQTGRKPLTIISTVGHSNQNLSLVFRYIIQYFEYLENDNVRNYSTPEHPCKNFPERYQMGTWILNKPISYQNAEVIMLYTQCSENDFYLMETPMNIFTGLNFRMSSLTILTSAENLFSKFLPKVKIFAEAGTAGGGRSALFQQLAILVSDSSITSFPSVGGRTSLEKYDKDSSDILLEKFKNVNCYLVPSLLISDCSWEKLKDFDHSLLKELEQFVERFINSETIKPRKAKGKKLTTSDLIQLLEKYTDKDADGDTKRNLQKPDRTEKDVSTNLYCAKLRPKITLDKHEKNSQEYDQKKFDNFGTKTSGSSFLSNDKNQGNFATDTVNKRISEKYRPTPAKRSIKSADDNVGTSGTIPLPTRRSNPQIMKDAIKTYKSAMKSETNYGNSVYCTRIEDAHKIAAAKSTTSLRDSLKIENITDNDDVENTVKKLKSQLKTELSIIEEENAVARQNFFEERIQHFAEQFKLSLTTTSYSDEKTFKKLSAKISKKLLEEMEEIRLKNDDLDDSPIKVLQETLDKIEKKKVSQNIRKSRESAELVETALDIAAVDYRMSMEKFVADMPLNSCHLLNRKVCLDKMKKDFRSEWNPQIEERLDARLETVLETLLKKQMDFKDQTKSIVSGLQLKYKNRLEECKEESEMEQRNFHMKLLTTILDEHDRASPYETEGDLLKSSNYELKKILEEYFESWMIQNHNQNQLWEEAKTRYANQMRILLSEGPLPNDEFDCKNEDILKSIFEWQLKKLQRLGVETSFDDLHHSAKKRLSNFIMKFQKENSQNFETIALETRIIEQKAIDDYNSKMRQNKDQARTPEELTDLHDSACFEAMKILQDSPIIKTNPVFLPSCEKSLKEHIDTSFKEIMNLFLLRITSRQAVNNTDDDVNVLKLYQEEMEKHIQSQEFMEAQILEKLHTDVRERVLRNVSFSSIARKVQLRQSVNEMFVKYQNKNLEASQQEPAIGIDLGTTYSCVAIFAKGKMHIIRNGVGNNTTPSYVAFQKDGNVITGNAAKEQAYTNPENTIFDAKRIIGRKFRDAHLQQNILFWPFDVVDDSGIPKISVNGTKLHPEEISAKLLAELKRDAEKYLKMEVKKAVITVPAYFTDGQRQATIDAGQMAGLDVISILNEPTAAALAYKLQQANDIGERYILIFDLGGGTFDVAVMKTSKGQLVNLGVHGDTHLGGEDFDKNLMNYCARKFLKEHKIDLFEDKDSTDKKVRDKVRKRLKRLQGECEKRKIDLANAISAEVSLDCLHGDVDLCVPVTKEKFEKLNAKLFDKTIEIVDKALAAANIKKSEINDIVLVGGSTRIPKIKEILQAYFNGKALNCSIDADEAVAYGAAMHAAMLNATIDRDSKIYAKVQDVTSMSIGMRTHGDKFSVIIPRNTEIPAKRTNIYRTAHDLQTYVYLKIYQGEDPVAGNNTHLGDFVLDGIPPGEAESEEVEVEMFINEQGILKVKVISTTTGASNVTVIENKQRMTREAIQSYIRKEENPLYQREVKRLL